MHDVNFQRLCARRSPLKILKVTFAELSLQDHQYGKYTPRRVRLQNVSCALKCEIVCLQEEIVKLRRWDSWFGRVILIKKLESN